MKASKMLISTSKEAPQEAKIDSHVLLLRAGLVKSLVAGVYNYLPMGHRVLRKIENIVREEMDESGALEILTSTLQPRELWDESKRWSKYGPELFRLTDRHNREFCLGPTHEEVFTNIARELLKSPKNLPMNLYQIQSKFRDEMRPRYGLMRGREFLMKDAYSFDKTEKDLSIAYDLMYKTYERIFTRLGLKFRVVLADTGAIGGDSSHQFMALSEIGESEIAYCDCGYAADIEKSAALPRAEFNDEPLADIVEVETPKQRTIEEVSNFLSLPSSKLCKAVVYYDNFNEKLIAAFVRGDREVNLVKLVNAAGSSEAYVELATDEQIKSINSFPGFIGPIGLENVEVYIDNEVSLERNMVVGANKLNYHIKNVNFSRDFTGVVADIRNTTAGDVCPNCGKELLFEKGIEVGQLFKLGTHYSSLMNCTYQNEEGKNVPMHMGCYGIGVSRSLQSVVEQHHDEFGVKWPLNLAPYHVVVVPINYEIEEQKEASDEIYSMLKANSEVILDDRKAKAGFKFKDWELIGIPYMIVVGKGITEGLVELKIRSTNETKEMKISEAVEIIINAVKNLK